MGDPEVLEWGELHYCHLQIDPHCNPQLVLLQHRDLLALVYSSEEPMDGESMGLI